MNYPTAVWVEGTVVSAEIPDLPGVITEADSFEALEQAVIEAATAWMECERRDGRAIPLPTSIENHVSAECYRDCTWILVDIDNT